MKLLILRVSGEPSVADMSQQPEVCQGDERRTATQTVLSDQTVTVTWEQKVEVTAKGESGQRRLPVKASDCGERG